MLTAVTVPHHYEKRYIALHPLYLVQLHRELVLADKCICKISTYYLKID